MAGFIAQAALAGASVHPATAFLVQVAAAAIDYYVANQIFQADPTEARRLNDLQVMNTAEGSPANRAFGRRIRVPGTVVWMPPVRVYRDVVKGGGKGGSGGSAQLVNRTFAHVAVEFARTHGEPFLEISRLWANGHLFMDVNPDIDISSNKIQVYTNGSRGWGFNAADFISDLNDGGPDLSVFVPGRDIAISGSTAGTHEMASLLTVDGAQSAALVGAADDDEGEVVLESSGSGKLRRGSSFTINGDSSGTEYFVARDAEFVGAGNSQAIIIVPPLRGAVSDGASIDNMKTNAAKNNGVFTCLSSGRDDRAGTTFVTIGVKIKRDYDEMPYQYAGGEFAAFWGSPQTIFAFGAKEAGDTLRLIQELPSYSSRQARHVRLYLGSSDQAPDPIVVAFEESRLGSGKVQAYTNTVLGVFEDLELTEFGLLPQFEAEVRPTSDDSLASMISQYCIEDAGFTEAEIDVSDLTLSLSGMNVPGVQSGNSALAPLLLGGYVLPVEREGVITFLDRRTLEEISIPATDLAASAGGEGRAPDEIPFKRFTIDEVERVDRVSVEFLDEDQDFRKGSVPSRGPSQPRNETTINVAAGMSRNQATQLADATLDLIEIAQDRFRFTLPPSYSGVGRNNRPAIQTGMIADLGTWYGQEFKLVVDKVEIGYNGLIVCEGSRHDDSVWTQSKTGMASGAA